MTKQCEFKRHGNTIWCRWCGTQFQCPDYIDHESLNHPCHSAPDYRTCAHIGAPTGVVKVSCKSGCGSRHQSFACDRRGRCLPTFRGPWDEEHQTEAAIYQICKTCEEFTPNK